MKKTLKKITSCLSLIVNRISEKTVDTVMGFRLTIHDLRFTEYSLILLVFLLSTVYCLLLSTPAYAADTFRIGAPKPSGYGVQVQGNADTALQTVINNGLRIIYSFGAILVVIFFIWGTVDWILSAGDKEKIANARKKMTQSLIGLLLLALSAVIITVVGEIINFNPFKVLTIPGLGDSVSNASRTP
jgi:hypothetical protein